MDWIILQFAVPPAWDPELGTEDIYPEFAESLSKASLINCARSNGWPHFRRIRYMCRQIPRDSRSTCFTICVAYVLKRIPKAIPKTTFPPLAVPRPNGGTLAEWGTPWNGGLAKMGVTPRIPKLIPLPPEKDAMKFSIVENLSGPQDSIFNLFRRPQCSSRSKKQKRIIELY